MKRPLTIDRVIGQLEGVKRYLLWGPENTVEVNREGVVNILNETIDFLKSQKEKKV